MIKREKEREKQRNRYRKREVYREIGRETGREIEKGVGLCMYMKEMIGSDLARECLF